MSDSVTRLLERQASTTTDPEFQRAFIRSLERNGADENTIRLERARRLGEFEIGVDYRVGDLEVKLIDYARGSGWWRTYKTHIAFCYNPPEPDMERPPYGMKGENAEHDRLWRKYNRQELVLQRKMIFEGLEGIGLRILIGQTPAQRLPWNPYAGCGTCKCSKGFNPTFDLSGAKFFCEGEQRYPVRLSAYVTRVKTPAEQAEDERRIKALKKTPRKKRKSAS